MEQKHKEALIEIFGEEHVTDALIDLVSYSSDATGESHRPLGAVWPENTEQVAALVKWANAENIPLVPRGAGTGLSGAVVPLKGGIVVDMARMKKILELNITDRVAVVQPGVVYQDLEKALAKYNFSFPPDPSSGKAATLGGNLGTNAGGVRGAKYGVTRDYVIGLEVVLGDGRVMRTGTRTMKTSSGYNLTGLFVGSEGTLGIVTEIILKINPKTLKSATTTATFDDIEAAGRAVAQIMSSGVIPSVLEIMGPETIRAVNENTDLNLPEVQALLLAETDGYTQIEADFQMDKVVTAFKDHGATEVKVADSAEMTAELWKARKSCYAVLARIEPNFALEDVTVPLSKVPALLKGVTEIGKRNNVQIATFGHAGDGNLHPQFLWKDNEGEEVERVHKAAAELFQLTVDLGGTLSGEHGIGIAKAPFMSLEHDEVEMSMMRGVKKLFDPNNILNPGKLALEG